MNDKRVNWSNIAVWKTAVPVGVPWGSQRTVGDWPHTDLDSWHWPSMSENIYMYMLNVHIRHTMPCAFCSHIYTHVPEQM